MFTPDEMAAHVREVLNTQTVTVPDGHKVAIFAGATTEGAKAAVAYRLSDQHDWTVNVYDQFNFGPEHNNTAGVTFKGSW